jgi:methylated-DNA-protein-cysteine methyltransferase related protein
VVRKRPQADPKFARRLIREAARPSAQRDDAIRSVIRSIPRGKVASYSQVATAAGYPLLHRLVVRILRNAGEALPWQRVVGSGGYIRLKGEAALEQRRRLEMEGVGFRGKRIDMDEHEAVLRTWELDLYP